MGKENKEKVVVRPDVDEELVSPKFEVKKQLVEDRFSLETVATQTSEVIVDKADNTELTVPEALVKALNGIDKLIKGLL
jgi:hypothetical protein